MRRSLFHIVLGFLSWMVFAYYWYIVGRRQLNPQTVAALLVVGILVFATVLFLVWWIFHNIGLYRRLQRRKRRLSEVSPPKHDYLGRYLVVDDMERLRRTAYIEVEVSKRIVDGKQIEEKVFRTSKKVPGS